MLRFSEGSYSRPIRSTKIQKVLTIRKTHIRNWQIAFFFSFDAYDTGIIKEALVWADAPASIIRQASESVSSGNLNEGFCFSNPRLRRSVVGVSETVSGPEFLNTTIHEIAHVAMHIAEEDGIDPYSEELAYLMGDISHDISYVVCELSCPHCSRKV